MLASVMFMLSGFMGLEIPKMSNAFCNMTDVRMIAIGRVHQHTLLRRLSDLRHPRTGGGQGLVAQDVSDLGNERRNASEADCV